MRTPGRVATAVATLLALVPGTALADHAAGGTSAGGPGPLAVAVMWGGSALVVGMLIVAVVTRLTRRAPPDDGETP
jgi:hypothetical protein